jgi:hypothetical protein
MSRKAMQMALEALELYQSKSSVQMFDDAVKALRQALETEQEPVCWTVADGWVYANDTSQIGTSKKVNWQTLYTAPPKREWVGLTDEEIHDYADKYLYQHGSNYGIKAFGKAIEAKLKERNT